MLRNVSVGPQNEWRRRVGTAPSGLKAFGGELRVHRRPARKAWGLGAGGHEVRTKGKGAPVENTPSPLRNMDCSKRF